MTTAADFAAANPSAILELLAERDALKADAERFVLFTSGKIDIMPAMVTALCTKVDTNTQWWREAIDAARSKT